jgi:hypothetical protein
METRHVKAALSAMTVKTDRKDARGIAQLIRMGWFRFSNRISLVNGFVAAPGHGSLRGRNSPPQHLVRSTGAARSTTS